jgi:hypothetical protein
MRAHLYEIEAATKGPVDKAVYDATKNIVVWRESICKIYRRGAAQRKLPFGLSLEEFKWVVSWPCSRVSIQRRAHRQEIGASPGPAGTEGLNRITHV